MTDNLASPSPDQDAQLPRTPPEKIITMELPTDIAAAIEQLTSRSGQTDPQAILHVLRSALGLKQNASEPAESDHAVGSAAPGIESQTIAARLTALESLIPRLEELEGKSIAF